MIRTTILARARRFVAALLLASVAWGVSPQTPPDNPRPPEPDAPAMALILPDQRTVFADAAEAVRLGFFAAHEAGGKRFGIQVVEVDDDPLNLLVALNGARQRGVKVAVGPLPRVAVNALIDSGAATFPVVALNHPDRDAGAPPTLISLGLSAESEAQYVVRVALAEFVGTRRAPGAVPRFVVLSGPGALERRVAHRAGCPSFSCLPASARLLPVPPPAGRASLWLAMSR